MSARGPGRCEPGFGDLQRQRLADQPGTECQHVGVIVFARVSGAGKVVTEGRTHSRHLVGDHGRSDAGAVDDDAVRGLARGHHFGNGVRKIWIINRFSTVGAAIGDFVALFFEPKGKTLLEWIPAMITPDCDRRTRTVR